MKTPVLLFSCLFLFLVPGFGNAAGGKDARKPVRGATDVMMLYEAAEEAAEDMMAEIIPEEGQEKDTDRDPAETNHDSRANRQGREDGTAAPLKEK